MRHPAFAVLLAVPRIAEPLRSVRLIAAGQRLAHGSAFAGVFALLERLLAGRSGVAVDRQGFAAAAHRDGLALVTCTI
jgi:hypothetical protein